MNSTHSIVKNLFENLNNHQIKVPYFQTWGQPMNVVTCMQLETWEHLATVSCLDETGKFADFLNDQCRAYIHFEEISGLDTSDITIESARFQWLVMLSFPLEEAEYFRFLLNLIPSEALFFEGGKKQVLRTPFDA